MKNIIVKLKSQGGESLGETLIALLISILGITLLAMMIQTSSNLIRKGSEQFESYITKENELVKKGSSTYEGQVFISNSTDINKIYSINNISMYDVYYYKNEINDIEVISYKTK